MVGKSVLVGTRTNKSSNSANGKIKSPKNVGTTPARSGSTSKTKLNNNNKSKTKKKKKKKSAESNDSDIAIVPSSSYESDNDIELIDEVKVEIDGKSKKRVTNGEENRGTKKGLQKNKAIGTVYSKLKPEKCEGKKEEKKKRKKVGDEDDIVLLEERNITAGMKKGNNNEGKKEDKKLKGKEVKAKPPEKSNKGSGAGRQTEGKKDDKKKVEKEKVYTDKGDIKRKKVEMEKERTGKRKNEDENTKANGKKQRTEVEETKKQMKEKVKQVKEGAKEEKKQKKVVVEVESEKDDQKVKKKNKNKNKEEEMEMEEENNVLYHFPMSLVSRIIKSEDFDRKIFHEAVFVINKAAEKFLELFCREAYACAFLDHGSFVAYNDLASVVSKRKRFDFLSDFVPEKVTAEHALSEMSKAEAEMESDTI